MLNLASDSEPSSQKKLWDSRVLFWAGDFLDTMQPTMQNQSRNGTLEEPRGGWAEAGGIVLDGAERGWCCLIKHWITVFSVVPLVLSMLHFWRGSSHVRTVRLV